MAVRVCWSGALELAGEGLRMIVANRCLAHRTLGRKGLAPARAIGFLALLIAIHGSPRAALFDDEEARRQISVERGRVDDLSARLSGQSQQLDAIAGRIGKLEEAAGRNNAVLDLFREIENLKSELAKMRGQLEVLANGIETAQKRQQNFYVDLDTRLRRLEGPAVSGAGAASPAGGDGAGSGVKAGTGAEAAPTAGGAAETRAYEAAQNLRRIGNYQGAIVAFQSFIKHYPKSMLAPSAQYWIGDSYFNIRDFRSAIASQRLLLASYPGSGKEPDALLNIASSQTELGDRAAARKTMDDIVAKYPASDAAEKARRRLANLR